MDDYNLDYFLETSAKTGFNAKNVFVEAAKTLYRDYLKYKDKLSESVLLIYLEKWKYCK